MRIVVLKESAPGETRVATTPDVVNKLTEVGHQLFIESGAGAGSRFDDQLYSDAGATIDANRSNLLQQAEVLFQVQADSSATALDELQDLPTDAMLIGLLAPFQSSARLQRYADQRLNSFAMEFMPRISRAQSMDVLSSQSNLAGYKAVLEALNHFRRIMPMMMTAAGAIPPAKVLVLGAGVAGLQAIATAKRLGAVVSAFDVRPEVAEQVESLGARFIAVETDADAVAVEGGYVKEVGADYQARQQQLIHAAVADNDIVITTALLMAKPAPILITKAMVEDMRPGSVIVDLAVTGGGNCELTERGQTIDHHGVTIIGHENLPALLSSDASHLYARNLCQFFNHLHSTIGDNPSFDREDELVSSTLLTDNGKVVHPWLKQST